MKVGDLVFCGSYRGLGVILSFDEDGDPEVYLMESNRATVMWLCYVKVVEA
jgi:hypothetical protein